MWENILKNVIILKSYFPYHGAQYGFFINYLYVLVFFRKEMSVRLLESMRNCLERKGHSSAL